MDIDLSNRTALVTGSTDGVGVGIARALAESGAFVVVSGRDPSKGVRVVEELTTAGGAASFVAADLARGLPALSGLVAAARDTAGGHLDILVNNAAMLIAPSPTSEVTEELITRALAVNVTAPFLLTGLLAPAMVERGWGAVVNVGSINGLVGMSGSALYGVTKAAVHALTRNWAAEYAASGVRVNTVAPGPTATPFNLARTEALAPVLDRIPSGRMSTVDEVGALVAFLASDLATNIHGATVTVDGGFTV